MTFLRNTSPTSHWVSEPIVPALMPEMQSPLRSFVAGAKSRSRGSMVKVWLPNFIATDVEVVHGIKKLPSPLDLAPGICEWRAMASAGGAMISVVPVSRIAERPLSPVSFPSTESVMAASQNPTLERLSTVTSVFGSMMVSSIPPNVS